MNGLLRRLGSVAAAVLGAALLASCASSSTPQDLPLGSTEFFRPAAMANLLGDVWADGEPNWSAALRLPDVKIHLYGKAEPRTGRKMGHITALADSASGAAELVRRARSDLADR